MYYAYSGSLTFELFTDNRSLSLVEVVVIVLINRMISVRRCNIGVVASYAIIKIASEQADPGFVRGTNDSVPNHASWA